MHEASLVRSLIRQVEQVAVENSALGVERVRVELGPLSGVERELVELAWRQLVPQTVCSDSALVLEEIPLCCRCRACGQNFQLSRIRFECPECRSDSIEVTGGDEFRLLDVTIRETIAAEGSAG